MAVTIGAMIGNNGYNIDILTTFLSILHSITLLASANLINNIRDYELDYRKDNEHKQRLNKASSIKILLFMFLSSLSFLALSISMSSKIVPFVISVTIMILIILYEYQLKSRGLMGNITVGLCIGSLFLFGGAFYSINITLISISVMAALSNISREIIKDIEDMECDSDFRNTFPITIGARAAALVSMLPILLSIPIAIVPIIENKSNLMYISLISFCYLTMLWSSYLTYTDRSKAGRSSNMYKFVMMLSLLAFLYIIL